MDLRLFCLFLVCLSLPGGLADGGEIRNITARGYWKRIFEDENSDAIPNEYTAQCLYGVRTEEDDGSTVTVKGSGPTYRGLTEGDLLKILSIDFGIEGQRKSSASFRTLKESDIHGQKEKTLKFTIQPGQKLVKWQFVVDIAGNEYAHNLILTHANDEIPKDFDVRVTAMCRKLIRFGHTQIHIKHRKSNRYLTVVERTKWPAVTTGRSNCYKFLLYNYGNNGVVIRTLNSMHSGYEYLCAWKLKGGWIYGEKFYGYSAKTGLYWNVCKSVPLYNGDVVSFMSQRFPDSYMCRSSQNQVGINPDKMANNLDEMASNPDEVEDNNPENTATDVFLCQGQEDEWILEIA